MTKTKKKEKIVSLDTKPTNVTEDQLKKVQDVVNKINNSHMNLGQMDARKHQLLHFLAGINDELVLVQSELKEQYGTDDIDIQNGTINYPKENGEVNKKD
jgi:hypothetical protein